VVILLFYSQSKSKVSKMRKKNQRTKLIIQPNFTEFAHHHALLIAHASFPPATRSSSLLTTAPCSSRTRPAHPPRASASARARLTPRVRLCQPAATSPRARLSLQPPHSAPVSTRGRLAPRLHARLSPRTPHTRPTHHRVSSPTAASSRASVPYSPPRELAAASVRVGEFLLGITVLGWGTGEKAMLGCLGDITRGIVFYFYFLFFNLKRLL
jgi:hypothetical protein